MMTPDPIPSPALPPLGQDDIALVRQTRSAFAGDGASTAAVFYSTLFRQAPGLRAMFAHDMDEQGRKLSATMTAAITAAEDLETLRPVLEELARRHVAFGVTQGHYTLVGRALLATLAEVGATPAHVRAWERLYAVLSSIMTAAAYPAVSGSAEKQ